MVLNVSLIIIWNVSIMNLTGEIVLQKIVECIYLVYIVYIYRSIFSKLNWDVEEETQVQKCVISVPECE
jgi:hypothetical protein